jgi:hypothetical protein
MYYINGLLIIKNSVLNVHRFCVCVCTYVESNGPHFHLRYPPSFPHPNEVDDP